MAVESAVCEVDPSAEIARDAVIRARQVTIGAGARVAGDVLIEADNVHLGAETHICEGCRIGGIKGPAKRFSVGDGFFLGRSSSVLVPEFVAGDYVTIHNHLLCNGYERCVIGHNSWIGQNCILNSTDELTIGNNVGIGAYSSVYTHAFNGELVEGCEIFKTGPVTIGDNAWLIGGYNVISPGVSLGERSVVLTSSVVSHDVPKEACVGGVPAKDLSSRISTYRSIEIPEKVEMMRKFVLEFVAACYGDRASETPHGFRVETSGGTSAVVLVVDEGVPEIHPGTEAAIYTGGLDGWPEEERVSVFDLSTKLYNKRGTDLERQLIRFMNGYRARFVPADCPRVK